MLPCLASVCRGALMTSMGMNWLQKGSTFSSAPRAWYCATTSGRARPLARQRGNLNTGTPSCSACRPAGQRVRVRPQRPSPCLRGGGLLHPSPDLSLTAPPLPSRALLGSMEPWPQPGPASGMPLRGLTLPTARTSERLSPRHHVARDLFTYSPTSVSPCPLAPMRGPHVSRFEDVAPSESAPPPPCPLRA